MIHFYHYFKCHRPVSLPFQSGRLPLRQRQATEDVFKAVTPAGPGGPEATPHYSPTPTPFHPPPLIHQDEAPYCAGDIAPCSLFRLAHNPFPRSPPNKASFDLSCGKKNMKKRTCASCPAANSFPALVLAESCALCWLPGFALRTYGNLAIPLFGSLSFRLDGETVRLSEAAGRDL